uniref:Nucleolar protein 16 n=1 Tax=Leptocylindrus danicus TaxID=163516 RepID=A0A7S2NXJ9_9STRA
MRGGNSKSRNKKRRSGRIGKTKLKNRSYKVFKPPQYEDNTIAQTWDPRKSASYNLEQMGLKSHTNLNDTANASTCPSSDGKGTKVAAQLFDIPESDVIPKRTKSDIYLPMSVNDQQYMARLFAKYGDDYKKMSWDIKLNDMQHTKHKLKKMGSRYLLLSDQERAEQVTFPENVRHLAVSK